ncbi:MAG: DUF4474 domain-containing protein [Acutalibacteraceae bacterium]|nr:DUF4474 domain-containing protein [Acutalibacteraceae bacterium]
MKTTKKSVRFIALVLVLIMVASASPLSAAALNKSVPAESAGHTLVMQSDHLTVARKKTIQMTATVTNVEEQPVIYWASSDESIATVDHNGVVKGVSVGVVTIAAATVVDGEVLSGEFTINVVRQNNFLRNLLEDKQVLSYQYSYIDDYYYTNDKDAWQYNFGFGKIYDFVSPYILLEYDYIRVFFTYENKDWMLQMWKGQYGLVFYGGEVGIYTKEHSDKGIDEWTFFNCPAEEDWINMEMTLWHEDINGNWNREFTREYDKYWWCTGFKNGHLRQEEPADELRLTGRMTFKDAEMTKLVADGLAECGLSKAGSKNAMGVDSIYVDGNDIHFSWQNISEAESTMLIKVSTGILGSLLVLPFAPMILPFVGAYAVLVLLTSGLL